jgi:hypothetical protein
MVDWRWWWLAERVHEGGGDLGPPDKTGWAGLGFDKRRAGATAIRWGVTQWSGVWWTRGGGGGWRSARRAGAIWGPPRKTRWWGSVLVNSVRGSAAFRRGRPCGAELGKAEVVVEVGRTHAKGGRACWCSPTKPSRAAQVGLTIGPGQSMLQVGGLLGRGYTVGGWWIAG